MISNKMITNPLSTFMIHSKSRDIEDTSGLMSANIPAKETINIAFFSIIRLLYTN
jgi:hypothetical protein